GGRARLQPLQPHRLARGAADRRHVPGRPAHQPAGRRGRRLAGRAMMKTLLAAYRVGELARSVDFYARVGFREIGRARFENGTTRVMLNLPGDGDAATIELVDDRAAGPIE